MNFCIQVFVAITCMLFPLSQSAISSEASEYQKLLTQLNRYKTQGLLASEEAWFLGKINNPLKLKIARVVFRKAQEVAFERLAEKLHIDSLGLNEECVVNRVCVFIIDGTHDPDNILQRTHAVNNAMSFPEFKLVIVDQKVLQDIMDASFSVSDDPDSSSDFLTAALQDPIRDENGEYIGDKILTLQLLNSEKGINMPGIVIEGDVQDMFSSSKVYTGIFLILHELGHVYNQDKINLWSAFHPGSDRNNIEILADKFALGIFDRINIFTESKTPDPAPDQIVISYLALGTYAELSYLLRRAHTYGIVELFSSGVDLPLKYHLADVHPPLEYRFLLTCLTLTDRLNSGATNPFLRILNDVKWSWSLQ